VSWFKIRGTVAKAAAAARRVAVISSSLWAAERKPASKAEGAR